MVLSKQSTRQIVRYFFVAILFFSVPLFSKSKIIGLMQVKNERDIVEQALRALACYTDAIIVLDDVSTDGTQEILRELSEELNIEKIIYNQVSQWKDGTEFYNRQLLLDTGRKYGGTHFIELDADEIIAATATYNNALRKKILSLEKGQILHLPLINLWKGFELYRSKFTNVFPDITYCSAIFCDDGESTLMSNKQHSHSGFIHFGRFPSIRNCEGRKDVYEKNLDHAILHLPYVNWRNVLIKQAWIMMLERIRLSDALFNKQIYVIRTVKDIDDFYRTYQSLDDTKAEFAPVQTAWLDYDFFDKTVFLNRSVEQKYQEIKKWMHSYGKQYFSGLTMITDILSQIEKGQL